MDESVIARMKEVDTALKELDPSVRGAAFAMMESYILGREAGRDGKPRVEAKRQVEPRDGGGGGDGDGSDDGIEAFFVDRDISKPADAVYALAGYLYSVYGSAPFTVQELRDLGREVGLTLPQEPDATLRMARSKKKTLFRHDGASWVPTTMGELVLKEKFDIKKGRKKRPRDEASEKGA